MAQLEDPTGSLTPQGRVVRNRLLENRESVEGFYRTLLHHPPLAEKVEVLGTFLRFDGVLSGDLRELAILVTARETQAEFVWLQHLEPALRAGLPQQVIDIIASKQFAELPHQYKDVTHASLALIANRDLETAIQARLRTGLGVEGLVELAAVCGFYKLVATFVFAFQIEKPGGHVNWR